MGKRPFSRVLIRLCFPCSSLISRREIALFRFDGLFCGFAVFDPVWTLFGHQFFPLKSEIF
jgi:hypothetical protein